MNKGNLERVQTLLSNQKFDEAIQLITSLKLKAANNAARQAAVERSKAEAEAARKERAAAKANAKAKANAAKAKANANAKARANAQAAENAARAAAVAKSRANAEAARKAREEAKAKANAAAAAAAAAAGMNPLNKELSNLIRNTNSKLTNNISANNINALGRNFMARGTNITTRAGGTNKFNQQIYTKALELITSLQELSRTRREKAAVAASEAAAGITNDLKAKYNSLRSAALNNRGANSPEVLQKRLAMLLFTYYKRGYHTKKPLAQNITNVLDRKMPRWRSINWTKTSKYT